MLSPHSAEASSKREAQGDYSGESDVNMAGFVVGPKGEDSDGEKERGDRGALRLNLRHAVEEDKCRNKENTAADADKRRGGTDANT